MFVFDFFRSYTHDDPAGVFKRIHRKLLNHSRRVGEGALRSVSHILFSGEDGTGWAGLAGALLWLATSFTFAKTSSYMAETFLILYIADPPVSFETGQSKSWISFNKLKKKKVDVPHVERIYLLVPVCSLQ